MKNSQIKDAACFAWVAKNPSLHYVSEKVYEIITLAVVLHCEQGLPHK
jgi:hypothetical protein